MKTSSTPCLISIHGASISYAGNSILTDINFDLHKGQHWLIQGDNGSGKTSLLKMICGLINPAEGIGPSRVWNYGGETSASPIFGRTIAALVTPQTQDTYRQRGWNISGRECVSAGLRGTPLLYEELSAEEEARISALFAAPEIAYLEQKSMLEMSRGESRKILLARAVAAQPQILVLDELLHELDPASREDVVRISNQLAAQGICIIYTSHRADETLPCTTHTARIENHQLIDCGAYDAAAQYIAEPPHHTAISGDCKARSAALISAENCNVFIEEKHILHNISFTLYEDMHTAIAGENGSGKTTLLRLLYGNLSPAIGGTISRFGSDAKMRLSDSQRHIGYASAELQADIDPDEKVIDVVCAGYIAQDGTRGGTEPQQIARAEGLLAHLGIQPPYNRPFAELSYGMQRKTVLARALISRPRVLLLDEPMSGLDLRSRTVLTELIELAINEGSTAVMAVHHAEDIPFFIKRIIAVKEGRIFYN